MYNLLTLLFCYITEKKMFIPNKTLTDLLQVLTILPLFLWGEGMGLVIESLCMRPKRAQQKKKISLSFFLTIF